MTLNLEEAEKLTKALKEAGIGGEKLNEILTRAGGTSQVSFQRATGAVSEFSSSLDKLNIGQIAKKITSLGASGDETFKKLTAANRGMVDSMTNHMKGGAKIIEGALSMMGQTKITDALDKVNSILKSFGLNILETQQTIMNIERTSLQAGVSFEKSFEAGRENAQIYGETVVEASMAAQESIEDVRRVQEQLSKQIGAVAAVKTLIDLGQAADNVNTRLTATTAAMLIGRATGMDYGSIVDKIAQAQLNLGETTSGAVSAFGRINAAAKGSGIGFDRVATSIFENADALKMWGGSIGSIAPVFEMFSRSLKGTGREGLTPDLLRNLVSGLSQMELGTRALLGIQAGPQAGGALGGALDIEAAMQEGESGMAKIVDSLTKTLTQFSGGKIITFQEARENPALQAQFTVQRQLLKSIVGGNDANAARTLAALQAVEKTGLQVGSSQSKELGELIGSGEKVAQQTTGELRAADLRRQQTEIMAGRKIIDAIKESGSPIVTALGKVEGVLKTIARKGGISERELVQAGKDATGKTEPGPEEMEQEQKEPLVVPGLTIAAPKDIPEQRRQTRAAAERKPDEETKRQPLPKKEQLADEAHKFEDKSRQVAIDLIKKNEDLTKATGITVESLKKMSGKDLTDAMQKILSHVNRTAYGPAGQMKPPEGRIGLREGAIREDIARKPLGKQSRAVDAPGPIDQKGPTAREQIKRSREHQEELAKNLADDEAAARREVNVATAATPVQTPPVMPTATAAAAVHKEEEITKKINMELVANVKTKMIGNNKFEVDTDVTAVDKRIEKKFTGSHEG